MAADPRVWILSRGRKGDLDQMLALTKTVGWPCEVKTLSFVGPEIPLLSKLLLKNASEVLRPPWPDVVLCAEASPSIIAREIKRRSGGTTRAVCVGRPAGSAASFDLVITTAQYRIPPAENVVELSMPLAASIARPPAETSDGPVALIVGGPAFPDRLDAEAAGTLAKQALAHAAEKQRRLVVHTSPRTPRSVIEVLRRSILPPNKLHVFGEGENRYQSLLAEASEIVVTSDSVSMVADGLVSGRPVSIFPLPQDRSFKWRSGEWLYASAVEARNPLLAPVRYLFDIGLVEAAADRRRLFARLVAERRLAWFGGAPVPPRPDAAAEDIARAVQSLRALLR